MAAARDRFRGAASKTGASLALVMLASCVCAAALPTPATVRTSVVPYLAKPLPSVQSIVGISMPPAAPMLVVASFSDDGAVPGADRGYAVGRTLNELVYGAHESLDVEAMQDYAFDVTAPNVVGGLARDARANAYRVATREAASWCVHGRVEGSGTTTRAVVVVDQCSPSGKSYERSFAAASDTDWPAALAEACAFVIATVAAATDRSRAACERARAIRSESFVAYASYATVRGMPLERLRALVAGDPKFAPAVVDLVNRLPYDNDKAAFLKEVEALRVAAGSPPAVALVALSRQAGRNAWKLEHRPLPALAAFIRANPSLRAPWMVFASTLSNAVVYDYPQGVTASTYKESDSVDGCCYTRNEATHSAGLALSLAYYSNYPKSYRAQWQVGWAVMQYALMLRGVGTSKHVPEEGRAALKPMCALADRFFAEALATQPQATALWSNRIIAQYHSDRDWMETFESAVALHPKAKAVYETAMNYAQQRWGGTASQRKLIEDLAKKNNPGEQWPYMLRERALWKRDRLET
jgi:hypothetical protein